MPLENKIIDKVIKEIGSKRAKILDDFARAYLAETGLKPSEVVLIEHQKEDKVMWFFSRKKENITFEI